MYSLLVLTVTHLDYTWRNHGFSVFTQNRENSTLHVYRGAAAPRSCPYIRFCSAKWPVQRASNVSGSFPFSNSAAILLHLIWPGHPPFIPACAVAILCGA